MVNRPLLSQTGPFHRCNLEGNRWWIDVRCVPVIVKVTSRRCESSVHQDIGLKIDSHRLAHVITTQWNVSVFRAGLVTSGCLHLCLVRMEGTSYLKRLKKA